MRELSFGAISAYGDVSHYERGRIEASRDVENNIFKVKSFGLLTSSRDPYSLLPQREYRIEFVNYGCVATKELGEYVRGYNDVSRAAIENRFGKGILE